MKAREISGSVAKFVLAAMLALFTVEITLVSLFRYVTGGEQPPQFIVDNGFANPFLILHVIGGVVALLLGPLQLFPALRRRLPAAHRASGRIYVAACAIAAPAGFMLALGTQAGPIAAWGFAIPAILWPVFTFIGVYHAVGRNLDHHRKWMLRSHAITANAITLRLMLPAAGLLGLPFMPAYQAIAWLGWTVNLAIVEIYLRRRPQLAEPVSDLALA